MHQYDVVAVGTLGRAYQIHEENEEAYEKMKNSQVNNGDVLLNITGGSIGRCCVISSDEKFNFCIHFIEISMLIFFKTIFNFFFHIL